MPVQQPSVYLIILTTENVWQGSTSENQRNSPWDPSKKKNNNNKKKSVVQFINPQTLIEDFICAFRESVQREE